MSLVEAYHAEHKARLQRMGEKPKPVAVCVAPIPPIDPEPYYAGMWFYNVVTYAEKPLDVRIEDIQRVVCKFYKISRHDMLSDRRTKNLAFPRQIAMYLSKKLTLRSMPAIGRRFNRWDHTTVLHAVRKIEALQEIDTDTRAQINTLRAEIMA